MKFIIGLGNPGKNYVNTRHNIGFEVLDEIIRAKKLKNCTESRLYSEIRFESSNVPIVLVRPHTFMNESGEAVRLLRKNYPDFFESSVLVVADEVYLPLGKIRIRPDGSSAGHNGLESVIKALSTQSFPRLRIGVGREGIASKDLADFVLAKFEPSEEKAVKEVVHMASEACIVWAEEGTQAAMNRFN